MVKTENQYVINPNKYFIKKNIPIFIKNKLPTDYKSILFYHFEQDVDDESQIYHVVFEKKDDDFLSIIAVYDKPSDSTFIVSNYKLVDFLADFSDYQKEINFKFYNELNVLNNKWIFDKSIVKVGGLKKIKI